MQIGLYQRIITALILQRMIGRILLIVEQLRGTIEN